MIRVTIELISAVNPKRNCVLGRVEIANTGTGTVTRASYRYKLFGKNDVKMDSGKVDEIPRKQMNALDLLTVVLVQARGEKVMKKLGR